MGTGRSLRRIIGGLSLFLSGAGALLAPVAAPECESGGYRPARTQYPQPWVGRNAGERQFAYTGPHTQCNRKNARLAPDDPVVVFSWRQTPAGLWLHVAYLPSSWFADFSGAMQVGWIPAAPIVKEYDLHPRDHDLTVGQAQYLLESEQRFFTPGGWGVAIGVYLAFAVVVMAIPQTRFFILDGVLTMIREAIAGVRFLCQPMVLLALVAVGGVIWFYHGLVNGHIEFSDAPFLDNLIKAIFAIPMIIALVGLLIFLLAFFVASFVLIPIVTLVGLFFLPGVIVLLVQYLHYLAVPHPAAAPVRQALRAEGIELPLIAAVRRRMAGGRTLSGGWISALFTHNRTLKARALRALIEEETATLGAFQAYLRAKHQAGRRH